MNYEQTCKIIFTDFVLLESAFNILNEYITNLSIDNKLKYKRVIVIRELAKKKIKSTIIDETAISALIKETNEKYNPKKIETKQIRSFHDLIYEDMSSTDNELIRMNYIYNSSIIYVDSIRDYVQVTNSIFKNFKINDDGHKSKNIFSSASEKPKVFNNHFNLLKHFLLENPGFKTCFQKNSEGMEISTLDSLIGDPSEKVIMGMILLNEEGKIQLQDNHKVITVDISECDWGQGYFTQGCIVLSQGNYKNDVFKAKCIVHPSPSYLAASFQEKYENDFFGAITKAFKANDQPEKTNMNVISNSRYNMLQIQHTKDHNVSTRPEESFLLNFLNKDLSTSKYLFPKLMDSHVHYNLESMAKSNYNSGVVDKVFSNSREAMIDEFFIVISNPDLTNQNVLTAIDKIISSYNQNTALPFMIVFIGNFTPENSFNCFKSYSSAFENLGSIILKNSYIVKNTYIVFIPGPEDFSLCSGFPKHPVLETVINPLKKKIPHIISASNPCRFSIFGKEFVFFRDNLNKKLARNSIPKKDISMNKDCYIYTVLCQGNLSPVDLNITNRIWHLSQSMMILPLPDYIFLADVVEDFSVNIQNSIVVNPGNFTKDYSFDVVFPLKNIVEPCKISLI